VTEAEWLACGDPTPMLEFLTSKASDRKLRLFAVAWCRRIWHLMTDERSRKAVEVAERFADGEATEEELAAAQDAAGEASADAQDTAEAATDIRTTKATLAAAGAAEAAAWATAWATAGAIGGAVAEAVATAWAAGAAAEATGADRRAAEAAEAAARQTQCDFLRDIFGPLAFRPSAPLPPAVLAWNEGTAPRLAEAIYEDRKMPEGTFDTGRLAILADALLDAGCEDEGLIQHCRSEGPHVRGCWAIDLILGKS
jgi:hypothetical protein